jgi:hypothetical protein
LMTEILCSPKIKPEHLARKAIVYLRQSSDKQVRQNLESQGLQYEVAERIRSLGWRHVEIIDSDLGSSAGMASALPAFLGLSFTRANRSSGLSTAEIIPVATCA